MLLTHPKFLLRFKILLKVDEEAFATVQEILRLEALILVPSMTDSLPTRGQLERSLSQRIQALYRSQLGLRVSEVDCQIFDRKIVIVLENSMTQPERLLVSNGKADLVEEVHSSLEETMQPQLKELIEDVVGVSVVDLLSDTTLATERTGMIAVLNDEPQIRGSNSNVATAKTPSS